MSFILWGKQDWVSERSINYESANHKQTFTRYFLSLSLNKSKVETVDQFHLTIVHETLGHNRRRHLTDTLALIIRVCQSPVQILDTEGETNWFSPMFLQIATDNCRLSVGSLHLGWYWSVYADLSQYAHLHTCVSEKTCPYWWKKYFQFWYVTETIIYISFGHKLDFCDDIISIYADGECSLI